MTQKYGNFIKSEFSGIFACLVLASVTAKTYVYWISSQSIYFYYFGLPYWIRWFEFLMSYDIRKKFHTNL